MSRNLRKKKSDWIVIDETGSEGDDDALGTIAEDSDNEDWYPSNKVAARKKDDDKERVNNLEKPKRTANRNDKNEATTRSKKSRKGSEGTTDMRERKNSSKTEVSKNEIIIDDEDNDGIKAETSLRAENRKRKGLMETVPSKKVKTKENSVLEGKQKRSKSTTDSRKEERRKAEADISLLSSDEITIDDEDDKNTKLETKIPVKDKTHKGTNEPAAPKTVKTTGTSSSKKKSGPDKAGGNRSAGKSESNKVTDDEKRDSDCLVEHRSSEKTGKKDKDEITTRFIAIDDDISNRMRSSRHKNDGENPSTLLTEMKKKSSRSKADSKRGERLAEADITLSSSDEIALDDEDDVNTKLETKIPVKDKAHRGTNEPAAPKTVKTTGTSSSKKKSGLDKAGGHRSVGKSDSNKVTDDEKRDSDCLVEHRSSEKTGKKDKDEITTRFIAIDDDISNRIRSSRDKNDRENPSTLLTEMKKKSSRSKADSRRGERLAEADITLSSSDEITIDDEDEEKPKWETEILVKNKRQKETSKTAAAKKIKITGTSSSKMKLAREKAGEHRSPVESDSSVVSDDEKKDSDYLVEYQSNRKTGRTSKDTIPEIDSGKSNRRGNTKEQNDGATNPSTSVMETKGKSKSTVNARKEERLAEADITVLSSDEMSIDDEDEEDMQLGTQVPVKNQKRKATDETAPAKKAKTAEASTSKKTSKPNAANENLPPVELETNKLDKIKKDNFNDKGDIEWSEPEYLSEFNKIQPEIAENLISLFKDDNTIPFIARYRKEMTGGMEADQLRSIKNTYDNLKLIKQRALVILRTIDKLGKWSPEIHSAVNAAKTMNELEHIYAPFKPGIKGSLAERARELGLAPIGETILKGRAVPSLSSLIDWSTEGLKNENDVRQGIIHIIADVISKDKTTFEGIHKLRKYTVINIESTKSKSAGSSKKSENVKDNVDHKKYENYFKFVSSEKYIKDYQILAINRGEAQKILSVKIVIPDSFQHDLKRYCLEKYNFVRKVSNFHYNIIEDSFDDAYTRLIRPLVSRQVRHDLNERAESASIEVFAQNLKKLLLTPPLRGKTVLGIDPGFTHGCKLAVISQFGNVLDTATIYPHIKSRSNSNQHGQVLAGLIKKHRCTIVALGNATACRETEMFLTDLIQSGVFAPLDVSYTIVNEAGASVYSCGKEAKAEFPHLDPNIISAISIARRLQDPLAELIKVEPKHLGIGMYQHDLPKKQLQLTLDEVITETVSFVGVDINTASHCLLRKVAGLTTATATNIITRRNESGPFINRKELLDVKRIGKKCFEQCAGFIRILPETASTGERLPSKKYSLDYLDQTWIHPESYDVAKKFLKACKCDLNEIGTEKFIQKVSSYANGNSQMLADQFGTSETSMDIIIKGLSMKKGEDIRIKEDAPLFRRNMRCFDDLSVNARLTGAVTNVTNFGTFVDIGVGRAGLIPVSKTKGQDLSLGQRVEVEVFSIEKDRQRIILSLC